MSEDPRPRRQPEKGFDEPARLSYSTYLKVPELVQLQRVLSDPAHPDELQFIVVHQCYELWFKLVLSELEAARDHLMAGRADEVEPHLRRVHEIENVMIAQLRVLETMTPVGFLGFRDHLRPASGFQSVQFREIEVVSGLRDPVYLKLLETQNVDEVRSAVARRLAEPSLRNGLHAMLAARGFDVGWDAATGAVDEVKLDAALLQLYRTLEPRDAYRAAEALLEHDQQVAAWRQRHVLMVERLIGSKQGTGGSSGAEYLKTTTRHRFFPELWRVRGELGGAW